MGMIILTDLLKNEEVLHTVKAERNTLQAKKIRKASWIDHILLTNCFRKHVIERKMEGRIEVAERRGRRRNLLLDDLKGKTG
jgi:hypothetical protein